MKKPKPTMTSREAAALILSQGATDDVEQAELMAAGQLLDPDALTRAALRRAMGFDFTIRIDDNKHKAIITDNEKLLLTSCTWVDMDDENNAKRLTRACMKLKKLHDKEVADA